MLAHRSHYYLYSIYEVVMETLIPLTSPGVASVCKLCILLSIILPFESTSCNTVKRGVEYLAMQMKKSVIINLIE